jgi:4-carboxymuconolactone decarboxylase
MRRTLVCSSLITFIAIASAQAPSTADLRLSGDRFKPLTYAQMTPAQKAMTDHILQGERHSMNGPFNVMLRSPEMGDLAQKFGAYVRFHSSLSPKLNEFAILITARLWTVQFEWRAHRILAEKAGLSTTTIEAVATGKRPAAMQPDEEVVYNFCTELLNKKHVSDATFDAAVKKLGDRGVVDLMGLLGYYQLVSMLLNVDRYPMPEGVQPELKPLQ